MNHLKEFRKFNYEKYDLIMEDSEFNSYQFGQNTPNPLGPGHGFASDPGLSIYGGADSPYVDLYSRGHGFVNDLKGVIDHINKDNKSIAVQKYDHFVNDIEFYENLKILRLIENESNYLDVFISFEFNETEYFGVYKNFNRPYLKAKLQCELYKEQQYNYINGEYQLKLSNYLRKILNNWFIPKSGIWKNLKEGYLIKDEMGTKTPLKENRFVDVKGYNIDENNNPYIVIEFKNEEYTIGENSYYWFKWYCEKLELKKTI
jgi:hypothetical protein